MGMEKQPHIVKTCRSMSSRHSLAKPSLFSQASRRQSSTVVVIVRSIMIKSYCA